MGKTSFPERPGLGLLLIIPAVMAWTLAWHSLDGGTGSAWDSSVGSGCHPDNSPRPQWGLGVEALCFSDLCEALLLPHLGRPSRKCD
jgi:hypothetical protein